MYIDRYFLLEDQWNVVHVPEQPNGYAILLIGDLNHYVEKNASFWCKHPGRNELLQHLLKRGYTIFYSNCYGAHWGSPQAIRFLQRLIFYTMKQEILNPHLYLLAEGMGGLAALKLAAESHGKIRSVALINPCISLRAHALREKENRLFYKRLLKELSIAYDVLEVDVEKAVLDKHGLEHVVMNIPCHIFQDVSQQKYPIHLHARRYYDVLRAKNGEASLTLYPGEMNWDNTDTLQRFFDQYQNH
ncbi:hypothetical protein [Aureibacillus halotolerans]|uniref:Serine aminopeptidase S33 family n=1 Tax=Aureibacillus halotolerans TaxID=1508390 RepID=A0A4R6UBI7_9BACI|nr:hypothetical protein [Aureibacillus halotolerans]TDQ42115.1 hypothetical protein EV213_102145 [Aureibacillus halotolerans]